MPGPILSFDAVCHVHTSVTKRVGEMKYGKKQKERLTMLTDIIVIDI